jgi:hypothetical protein
VGSKSIKVGNLVSLTALVIQLHALQLDKAAVVEQDLVVVCVVQLLL